MKKVSWLLVLLVFVPISAVMVGVHAPPVWVFLIAAMAIVPLAGYISRATEELAKHLGPSIGGLLNATFGNATELIIALFAVRAGQLDVVRSSIIGSVIGNILLVMGLSILLGGLRYKRQTFNVDVAGTEAVMLMLAVVTMVVPSLFVYAMPHATSDTTALHREQGFSLWVAGLLIALYLGNLFFSLITHREMFSEGVESEEEATTQEDKQNDKVVKTQGDEEAPPWSKRVAFAVLTAATIAVAWESEVLVSSIEPTVQALGVSKLFVGVIVVPIIGNAAEHATAVSMALKNKIDVTVTICINSSTQIALFVAPLIIFLSLPLGHPMLFLFNGFELIAVGFSGYIAALIARDGDTNWFEGAQLLVLYAILACAFYFIPAQP